MKTVDYCTKRCFLCDEVNEGEPLSYFLEIYKHPTDKILFESPHFVAMPDISPIVPGHTLLFPKDHILSLSRLEPDEWQEFKLIKSSVTAWLREKSMSYFVFEHGTVSPEISSGICVKHAHLHFIPAKIDNMADRLQLYTKESVRIAPVDMETAISKMRESYLYYENAMGSGCALQLNDSIPQQFIRKVVAEALHLPDWDWKNIALPYLL